MYVIKNRGSTTYRKIYKPFFVNTTNKLVLIIINPIERVKD